MSLIYLPSESPELKKNTKEMLSLNENGTWKINFSSLALIQTCMRKAYYCLDRGYRLENESDATALGSAIHKALEYWYCLPFEQRLLKPNHEALAKTFGFNSPASEPYDEGALEALRQFQISAVSLMALPEGDKRHPSNGLKILTSYFKHYASDRLRVVRDSQGPIIERKVSFRLTDTIEYFGTIDCVLEDADTGQILVCDHKTTAQLGVNFFNRLNPNHQYTGYVLAANKALNISAKGFLVNGIQIAKTKTEFARQITERGPEDFKELEEATVKAINDYSLALKTGVWPMSTPGPCAEYGGCTYLDICSSPKNLRQGVIDYKYGEKK